MKLISINIECNKHTDTVLGLIKKEKAEVVCFQELLAEEFEFYKKELALPGVFQPWGYFNSPTCQELIGRKQGVAIFAKDILESGSIFYAGKEENIFKSFAEYAGNEELQKNKALIWANTKNDKGEIFKFITTQLPVTKEGEVTPYQLEVIDSMLSKLNNLGEFVLCGDMNAPRGHESFRRIAEKYKDNIPEGYKTSIDQNLHRVKGIQFMVDGLFTTPAYKALEVKLVDGISDHMAVVALINKISI